MTELTENETAQIKAALAVAERHLDDPRLRDALDRVTALVKLCHTDELEDRIKGIVWYKGSATMDQPMTYCPYIPLQRVSLNTQAPSIQHIKLQAVARSIGPQWGYELPPEEDT